MDKVPRVDTDGGKLYAYRNMELPTGGFRADVLCCCEGCSTTVEAGYTPPDRLLSAFGYSIVRGMRKNRFESTENLPEPDREFFGRRAQAILEENGIENRGVVAR